MFEITGKKTRQGSNVARIFFRDDNGNARSVRVAKLLGLQGISSTSTSTSSTAAEGDPQRTISSTMLYNAAASFLASKHFNERKGMIFSDFSDDDNVLLEQLLNDCDFYWDYEYRDGQQQGMEATRQFLQAMDSTNRTKTSFATASTTTTTTTATAGISPQNYSAVDAITDLLPSLVRQESLRLEPFAIYGAYWSRVSLTLSSVTASFEIPYMTGVSTSSDLDGRDLFARTIPTNDGHAHAILAYYKSLGVQHIACLFVKDAWGIHYHAAVRKYGNQFGIDVKSFSYATANDIEPAILDLKRSEYRYVFVIMTSSYWKQVIETAYLHGILGNSDYMWIAANQKQWTGENFALQRDDPNHQDYRIAQALHGMGTINIQFQSNQALEGALTQLSNDKELQREFIDLFASSEDRKLFEVQNFTFPRYDSTAHAPLIYDAIMALGLAGCNYASSSLLPHDLFTAREFYKVLLKTEFQGVSGYVTFDPGTGTRRGEDIQYSIDYVSLSDERSDPQFFRFDSQTSSIVQKDTIQNTNYPFLYHDNSTVPPSDLPPLSSNNSESPKANELNLLPVWAQSLGYSLAVVVILFSMVCMIWTYTQRRIYILKTSQPFFLIQLCIGTALMATAIYPASLPASSTLQTLHFDINTNKNYNPNLLLLGGKPDDTKGMDMACMSMVWLAFLGFSVAFSALVSKIWRIRQIMKLGSVMLRAAVPVKKAMAPLYLSLAVNTALLLSMTLVSPLQYERIAMSNFDTFGRSIESYGSCVASGSSTWYFLTALFVFNFLEILASLREGFKAKDMPQDFSDAHSLFWAMMSLFESLVIGAPLLVVVNDDPTALYLVGSCLLCMCCMAILLLIFLPKYRGRHRRHRIQSVVQALHNNLSTQRISGGDGLGMGSNHSLGHGSNCSLGTGSNLSIGAEGSNHSIGADSTAFKGRGSNNSIGSRVSVFSNVKGRGSNNSVGSGVSLFSDVNLAAAADGPVPPKRISGQMSIRRIDPSSRGLKQ